MVCVRLAAEVHVMRKAALREQLRTIGRVVRSVDRPIVSAAEHLSAAAALPMFGVRNPLLRGARSSDL